VALGKTMVKDGFVFFAELFVTPGPEEVDFFGQQGSNCFSQLFLEELQVKTHFLQDGFGVFQHGSEVLALGGLWQAPAQVTQFLSS
jgi:hypothetical protein